MRRRLSFPLIIILLLFSPGIFSQGEDNNWYFGGQFNNQTLLGAGLDFNNIVGGIPSFATNTGMTYTEGSATMSDGSGNIMFYTDGDKVFGSNHTVMPNGNNLGGHWSTMFPALIVPNPADGNQFYIFSNDGHPTSSGAGLFHSLVDVTLNNCNGDVVPGTKKTGPLVTNTSELLSGAYHANGTDFWAIVLDQPSVTNAPLKIYAYQVSATGVSAPVITDFTGIIGANFDPAWFKMAPNNQKAVVWFSDMMDRKMAYLDFNNTTGQFTFNTFFGQFTNGAGEDVRKGGFSPNSQLYYCHRYVGWNIDIVQYDLTNLNAGPTTVVPNNPGGNIYDFRIGPDNKLYIINDDKQSLSVLSSPNLQGAAANFQYQAVPLGGRRASITLPNASSITTENLRTSVPVVASHTIT